MVILRIFHNLAVTANQAILYSDEVVNVHLKLEASKKVKNIVTVQCLLIQEVVIMKSDGERPKKRIEFELAIQSKNPHLPVGISTAELEFSFDLGKSLQNFSITLHLRKIL